MSTLVTSLVDTAVDTLVDVLVNTPVNVVVSTRVGTLENTQMVCTWVLCVLYGLGCCLHWFSAVPCENACQWREGPRPLGP